MQNTFFITLFFLVVFRTNAQIINITDANFKTKLAFADVTNSIIKDLSVNYIVKVHTDLGVSNTKFIKE
jgi:hypothetical protein